MSRTTRYDELHSSKTPYKSSRCRRVGFGFDHFLKSAHIASVLAVFIFCEDYANEVDTQRGVVGCEASTLPTSGFTISHLFLPLRPPSFPRGFPTLLHFLPLTFLHHPSLLGAPSINGHLTLCKALINVGSPCRRWRRGSPP